MKILHNFILILSFFLTFSIITHSQPVYLYHICPNTTVFTGNSNYPINRNQTLSSLSSNSSRTLGFYNTSSGQGPNDVFGLFLCRGDATTGDCQNCVATAAKEVVDRCPVEAEAVIWYDMCFLRYSNHSLASMAQSPAVYMWSTQNVSDQALFISLLSTSMKEAATSAANAGSGEKKFAVKEVSITAASPILYNLAQCTPDLSTTACIQCLDMAISQLPACCNETRGGRVLTPSCNIRYESYRFYNVTTPAIPSLSPPPSPVIVPPPPRPTEKITVIIVIVVVTVFALSNLTCIFMRRRNKKKKDRLIERPLREIGVPVSNYDIEEVESLQFDLDSIRIATNDFSEANKLGKGGFGVVYMGIFPNRQEIAVKRLSKGSGQGELEFKNEVLLMAKLQHRNLVRLLGFCYEGEERLLVYEFVANSSLDNFIFDPIKKANLDWTTRYRIIGGIARGLVYLHEDSRLRIIHHDLKASNILLDEEMTPKISDFGLARLFAVDQTQDDTSRIAGTFGYMAPEYVTRGHFSVKSDVFSFGVLFLEIVSGQKNNRFHVGEQGEGFLTYVWNKWNEGTALDVIDPTLIDGSVSQMMRCIHIGLLCVQESEARRPTMAQVMTMLSSNSIALSVPSKPAFFIHTEPFGPVSSSLGSGVLTESDGSRSTGDNIFSINEASITELHPR